MSRLLRLAIVAAACSMFAPSRPLLAQDHGGLGEAAHDPTVCTFCLPWVFLELGGISRQHEALPRENASETAFLVKGLVEVGTPIRHLGFFSTVEFVPDDNPAPRVNYGVKLWARPRFTALNATAGIGLTSRINGIGENRPGIFASRGWAEAGAEYQSNIDQTALYAQIGAPLSGEAGMEIQFGIRHPLAPFKFRVKG